MPKRPEYPPEIEEALPVLTELDRATYERMAEEARERGETCTWADVRLADIKFRHFPKSEAIKTTADVRAVHLTYLAYQRLLLADLDAPEPEVQAAAERQIRHIAQMRGGLPFNQVKGGSA